MNPKTKKLLSTFECRQMMYYLYESGMELKDIAVAFNISPKTVTSKINLFTFEMGIDLAKPAEKKEKNIEYIENVIRDAVKDYMEQHGNTQSSIHP